MGVLFLFLIGPRNVHITFRKGGGGGGGEQWKWIHHRSLYFAKFNG